MAAVTLTPAMQTAILLATEIALKQLLKETKGMTQQELVTSYIPKQQRRKAKLLKLIDEA